MPDPIVPIPGQEPGGTPEVVPVVEGQEPEVHEDPPEEIPAEVLRTKLTEANKEAADYRVQAKEHLAELTELRSKLAEAKTADEVDALVAGLEAKLTKAGQATARERAGRIHGLPDAMVARLQGTTEEEILADAEELAKLLVPGKPAPPAPLDPRGGRNPGTPPDDTDEPGDGWRKAKRRM